MVYQKTCIKAMMPDANDDVSGAVDIITVCLKPHGLVRESPFSKPLRS